MPGMLRGKLGGIPSVGISHGQVFSIADKPSWVKEDKRLNKAWEAQSGVNRAAAWFSSWQIGTNFVPLEASSPSAAVARPPLRQEVKRIRQSRMLLAPLTTLSDELKRRLLYILQYGADTDSSFASMNITDTPEEDLPPRKVVLCYFRDRNGKVAADALLEAGFDVILFNSGWTAVHSDKKDPHEYGSKWIVKEKDRIALRKKAKLEPDDDYIGGSPQQSATAKHRRLSTTDKPRLIRIVDRSLFVPFMSIADGIASSAGSQLMSECIYTNLHLLALHDAKDNEQLLNVAMSRHSRSTTYPNLAVYGSSLEQFTEAFDSDLRLHLRSNRTSTKTKTRRYMSAGAKVAAAEFRSFVEKVQTSPVSVYYQRHLLQPAANQTAAIDTESDDPFRGMLDASGILLEIIKQVQRESP
jgi:hypothetical protein